MKVIPTRSFLVRQDDIEGGKKKDVIATKGVPIDLNEKECAKFFGSLKLDDRQKKSVLAASKAQGHKRVV